MIRYTGLLKDPYSEKIIYEAIKADVREFATKMKEKYKPKLKKIEEIKNAQVGFKIFEIDKLIWDYIKEDEDLRHAIYNAQKLPLVTRKMVKQIFKDCFNEILDEPGLVEVGQEGKEKVKSKRMLLAEMIVNGVLSGDITANQLRGLEIIRDTVGEKPANEIISAGIQQKIVNIDITKEKVDKVKGILESLRRASIADGLKQDFAIGGVAERPRDEGIVEVDVSGEPEGVHNADVLPDKQD